MRKIYLHKRFDSFEKLNNETDEKGIIISKLNEANKKANKKWDTKNKDRKQYLNKRSNAKNFILKLATKEDLEQIKEYIKQRENELQ